MPSSSDHKKVMEALRSQSFLKSPVSPTKDAQLIEIDLADELTGPLSRKVANPLQTILSIKSDENNKLAQAEVGKLTEIIKTVVSNPAAAEQIAKEQSAQYRDQAIEVQSEEPVPPSAPRM
ncbi:hypothetical protein [Legionella clemsonensis]|uniref:Uncharacterized protein n=1 Tax=Legionella clemsonensis TaxID=1867846 RepID=A0A222P087_9GAMM|nr:hypothetical protein [Legionella clemsonensis]ASQ45257.1 hypothetical protein clem_03495 [Legionella clemsonensis]